MVKSWTEKSVDGELVKLYPEGTRVRHKTWPELAGTIVRLERHESGAISPLPFFVEWDDGGRASELLGIVSWYASAETVEPGEAKRVISLKEAYSMKPCEVRTGDVFPIKVVAVAGHADDWAAYMGPSDWPDKAVAEQGTKLADFQAEPLFYVLRESGRVYRE